MIIVSILLVWDEAPDPGNGDNGSAELATTIGVTFLMAPYTVVVGLSNYLKLARLH